MNHNDLNRRRALAIGATLWLLAACGTATPPAFADPDGSALRRVVDGPQRSPKNAARDAARHPYETLRFFGVQPGQTVIEIAPGGGWYTEILAPYLRDHGRYIAALYTEDGNSPAEMEADLAQARTRFEARFADAGTWGPIAIGTLRPNGLSDVGAPGSADAVLTFRNIHNWIADDHFDADLRAFYAALKPGGVLGVEEHRAPPGTTLQRIIDSGYVPEQYVIDHAKAAGFELEARSQVNANPRDDTQHPNGVWSLPPTLRGGETDRAKFVAIGESDRMTLRFVKR